MRSFDAAFSVSTPRGVFVGGMILTRCHPGFCFFENPGTLFEIDCTGSQRKAQFSLVISIMRSSRMEANARSSGRHIASVDEESRNSKTS